MPTIRIFGRCKNAFCSACIKRNLGRKAVTAIEEDEDWRCLECEPDQLRVPRALFYSIYQYWVRERAKAEKRQERLNMKKSASDEDDPVMGLLEHAEQASTILSDYIKNEQGKWRRRRGLIRANGGKGREEAMLHVAENLKKIIKVTNHNLKEVARIADKTVADEIKADDNSDDPGANATSGKEGEEDNEDVTTPTNGDVDFNEVKEGRHLPILVAEG